MKRRGFAVETVDDRAWGWIPMKWAATNALGAGAWLLGIVYAKPTHAGLPGITVDGEQQLGIALACAVVGAVILLWANLSAA